MAKYRICVMENGDAFIQRRIFGIWFSEKDPSYQSGGYQPRRTRVKMYPTIQIAQDEIYRKRKEKKNKYPKVFREYEV